MDLQTKIAFWTLVVTIIGVFIQLAIFRKTFAIQKGQLEIQIRDLIERTRTHAETALKAVRSNSSEKIKQAANAALESHLNAYDEACQKYIENKIDQKSFKNLYFHEIYNLINNDNLKEKFVRPTKYGATRQVYDEWFPEKK